MGKANTPEKEALRAKRISESRIGMKFSKTHREAIRQSRIGTKTPLVTRRKLSVLAKQRAADPEWRRKVSDGTRRAMRRPETKELHRAAVTKARRVGVFFEKQIGKILIPLGYVSQFYVHAKGMRRGYLLDFALPKQKIAIECDGPSHGTFKQRKKDLVKTNRLHRLGWKVIRVPYV